MTRQLLITIEGDSPDECGECRLKTLLMGYDKCPFEGDDLHLSDNRLPECLAAQEAATNKGE